MTRSLRIVASETTPEADLRVLFRREASLVAELAEVRSAINAARSLYMAKHRTYGVRVERLRGMLG